MPSPKAGPSLTVTVMFGLIVKAPWTASKLSPPAMPVPSVGAGAAARTQVTGELMVKVPLLPEPGAIVPNESTNALPPPPVMVKLPEPANVPGA